jgi:hypothetical protein
MPRAKARKLIPTHAVTRVDRRYIHGWRIHIKRGGKDHTALVHDHDHKGRPEHAHRAAIALYHATLQELPPPLRTLSSDPRCKGMSRCVLNNEAAAAL